MPFKSSHAKHPHREFERLANVPFNEPVFVLRAQDVFAAELVERWCDMAAECKVEPAKG